MLHLTGMSNCKLFVVANLSISSGRTSLFTSILVATFERADRYTTTHATSVANSSSLKLTIYLIIQKFLSNVTRVTQIKIFE